MKYKPRVDSYWLKTDAEFDIPIEVVVDGFYYTPIPEGTIRIIIIQEPYNYNLITTVLDKNNDKYYTYVFTYHQQVLDNNKKSIHFICVHTWIKNYKFPPKKFSVSTLVGGKTHATMEGLDLRHILWHRQHEIKIPKDFYLSSQCRYLNADYYNSLVLSSVHAEKQIMFNNQFHIVIENTSIRNMFTEKILDCFQTKTIPIFYGAPNIGDFFNINGILAVKTIDEIINICNTLTPEVYNTKLVAIEDNYQRSMEYLTPDQVLNRKINEILNK